MSSRQKNHQCVRKGKFRQKHAFYQFKTTLIHKKNNNYINIIEIKHLDDPSNACAMPNIEPHNPIQFLLLD